MECSGLFEMFCFLVGVLAVWVCPLCEKVSNRILIISVLFCIYFIFNFKRLLKISRVY